MQVWQQRCDAAEWIIDLNFKSSPTTDDFNDVDTVKPVYSGTIGTAEIWHYKRDDTIAGKSRLASIFCRVFCENRMGNYVKQNPWNIELK